ncbi:hypothetical protein ACH47Z_15915 [Streptomyces sp. NPDC020192]|uniref:hypothetical protein n=1 Tax=Streptomyces sp. NPDC020192 TaxID=3365066 RepID=UPI0037893A4B
MRGLRFRTASAVVAVVAVLGPVSGCGGSGAGPTPSAQGQTQAALALTADLVKVEDASAKEHSARVEGIHRVDGVLRARMTGELDWADGQQGDFTLTMPSSPQITNARFEFRKDAIYMSTPAKFLKLTGGKHWLRTPLGMLAAQSATQKARVDMIRQANPTLSVRMLIASGDVHRVGRETVHGVATTHYAGTLDASRLATLRGRGLTPDDVKSLKEELAAKGITQEHVDVWVDSRNLLVEKRTRTRTAAGEQTSTAYYSHYGLAVDVSVPALSDTTLLPPPAPKPSGTA